MNLKKESPRPTIPTKAAVVRSKKVPEGFLFVVKGRSYTQPMSGIYPPLIMQQDINGMVGMEKPFGCESEDLKKTLGFVVASTEDTMSSGHFVLGSKELRCRRGPPYVVVVPRKVSDDVPKVRDRQADRLIYDASWSNINPRLYPDMHTLLNRRKQGQCYSLMMEAKCHQRLFYADLNRASTFAAKVTFIRRQREIRAAKNNLKFQGHDNDESLILAVKKQINVMKKKTNLLVTRKERSANKYTASRKSDSPLDTDLRIPSIF